MPTVTTLPFNQLLGLEPLPEPGPLVRLPEGPQYLNHLATVHAGALLALAEATSGEFLLRQFGSLDGVLPVVRRMESKFRKPAKGAITGEARVAPEALAQFQADYAAKGRALVAIDVELRDAEGIFVFSAQVEWFVQRLAAPDAPTA